MCVCVRARAEKHLSGVDPAKAKQAHAALLDFVLESAKSDLEPEDVTANLEEINASDKLTTPLVAGFREHKVCQTWASNNF